MRSYSFWARSRASSVTFKPSLSSSTFRLCALLPPNILLEDATNFSIRALEATTSDMRVCTVNSALERSENAACKACIKPRYSCNSSCHKTTINQCQRISTGPANWKRRENQSSTRVRLYRCYHCPLNAKLQPSRGKPPSDFRRLKHRWRA